MTFNIITIDSTEVDFYTMTHMVNRNQEGNFALDKGEQETINDEWVSTTGG